MPISRSPESSDVRAAARRAQTRLNQIATAAVGNIADRIRSLKVAEDEAPYPYSNIIDPIEKSENEANGTDGDGSTAP